MTRFNVQFLAEDLNSGLDGNFTAVSEEDAVRIAREKLDCPEDDPTFPVVKVSAL